MRQCEDANLCEDRPDGFNILLALTPREHYDVILLVHEAACRRPDRPLSSMEVLALCLITCLLRSSLN